jgi:anti-anti-sigma factor
VNTDRRLWSRPATSRTLAGKAPGSQDDNNMPAARVDIATRHDGTVVIQPHGAMDDDSAVHLQQLLVHALRHIRPHRLVLDLSDVSSLDPINVGSLAAACHLGDDHQVAVFLDDSAAEITRQLAAAGIPPQRLRHSRTGPGGCGPVGPSD